MTKKILDCSKTSSENFPVGFMLCSGADFHPIFQSSGFLSGCRSPTDISYFFGHAQNTEGIDREKIIRIVRVVFSVSPDKNLALKLSQFPEHP